MPLPRGTASILPDLPRTMLKETAAPKQKAMEVFSMSTPSQVLEAAMALSLEQRAEVAHNLLLSLETADFDQDADQAWAAEVRRRLQAIREGRVVLHDWDDALARIRRSISTRDKQ